VVEAVALVVDRGRVGRAHELTVGETDQVLSDPLLDRVRSKLVHRVPREDQADHRRRLDHGSLLAAEPVETGGEQRLDRRRHGEVGEVGARRPATILETQQLRVDQHGDELLDEERIALGGCDDPAARVGVDAGAAEQRLHDPLDVRIVERLQRHAACALALGPVRSLLEQLVPGGAEEQQRGAGHRLEQVLDQVEKRRRCPVDVVEEHDHRPVPAERLEQLARAPEDLLDREGDLGQPDDRGDAIDDLRVVVR
jgi:hypothetical protein